ncbi:hypothetical protein AVEN_154462-1 [Araneus ventricosus]|uniref:Uncharacterized protein n=1 Tax=Araneus ventricosus TaxID=182803 RepID=A0A4Y2HTL7_ARAVE|nr:hypothetical protein AVEN_154462-1 [Araneus ventricosus]
MSALHKGGTLKPSSPGLEHVDVINEDLNDITEQELEQELQNLLATLSRSIMCNSSWIQTRKGWQREEEKFKYFSNHTKKNKKYI